jgi:predicted HAD superfamily phosphohydrolase YqeG
MNEPSTGARHVTQPSPLTSPHNPSKAAKSKIASDWLLTVRQNLFALPRLWPHLRPTFHLSGVAALTPEFLAANNITGIVWDVDGTLMGCHHKAVAAHLQGPFHSLLADQRFQHVVLSNCADQRFHELGRIFPDIPIVRGYTWTGSIAFQRLHRGHEHWEGGPAPKANRQPIRKPNAVLLEHALSLLQVPPATAVVVGDQYLTDIASANLVGVRSIKVPTLEPGSFSIPVRLLQHFDASLHRLSSLRKQ